MEVIQSLFEQIRLISSSSEVVAFIDSNLLLLIYVSLAFGFAALLVEVRLPLKYYWDLPLFFMAPFLESLGLAKKRPVWGRVVDSRTNLPIPITAVELLDKDSLEIIKTTFTDREGNYGFNVKPGHFVVRAVKNNYIAPPFFDPENIQLQSTDESLALPIEVTQGGWPTLNLVLEPTVVVNLAGFWQKMVFYFRAFSVNLANGFLALALINSWYGWVVKRSPLFAILLAVSIVFMFIKLYILEAVGSASRRRSV